MLPNKERSTHHDALRASALVDSLRKGDLSSAEVFAAFDELDRLPRAVVESALGDWTGPAPDLDRLDDATRHALRLPPRERRLRLVAVVRDADLLDLGPVAEDQIRLAGKSWDGVDREAVERLDGEVEGSFAGTLIRRTYADDGLPDGPAVLDVLFFAGDSALVFRAGTTEILARISDGALETADRRLRSALADAFALPDPEVELEGPDTAPSPAPAVDREPESEPEREPESEPESESDTKKPKAASAARTKTKKSTAAKKTAAKKATTAKKKTTAAKAGASAKKKAAAADAPETKPKATATAKAKAKKTASATKRPPTKKSSAVKRPTEDD